MNKIKDFIYDKNDLLVALLIIALATMIIAFRVDVIMAYPSSGNVATDPPVTEDQPSGSDDTSMGGSLPDSDGDENPDGELPSDGEIPGEDDPDTDDPIEEKPPVNPSEGEGLVSIYIKSGSTGSDIAKLLVEAGLVKTKDDFYDAVQKAGADTKLQAGNFKVPSNSTPEEIVKIITN